MSGVRRNPSPEKLAFAREMRAHPTDFEKRLCIKLKKGIKDVKFTDQVVMLGYILDFYCPEIKLAIELDGNSHNIHSDKNRDSYLFAQQGISVMRYGNPKSEAEINAILFDVFAECRWRLGRIRRGFSTFSQRLSFQDKKNKGVAADGATPVKICAKVENLPEFKPSLNNLGCPHQVFATVESAEVTVTALRHIGIEASVELCPTCNLIRLIEKRVEK
jgi:adenine-specific DNA-methyltransferase